MIIGSVNLAAPHAIGGGTLACSGLAPVLMAMDAVPNQVTIYSRATYNTPQQKQTTYTVNSIGGNSIAIGSALVGSDQAFAAGDLVYLQYVGAAGAGTGTVTSIATTAPITGGTITGTGTIALTPLGYTVATTTFGSTTTFNLSTSSKFQVTLTSNATLALSNDPGSGQFTVILLQDGTGSRTVTWWSGILWVGGTVPTLTTTASKRDVFSFIEVSLGVYLGFVAGQNL